MSKFILTIYSPEDDEAQPNIMYGNRDQRIATMALLMDAMEPGAWFKVESVND